MRISQIITLILLSTIVLTSGFIMIDDAEKYYIDTNISNASPLSDNYTSTYDRSEEINSTLFPLQKLFDDLGKEEEGGWFTLKTAMAIPTFIVRLPGMIFAIIYNTIEDINSLLIDLGVPQSIILLFGLIIIVAATFFVIDIIRRYKS